MVNDVDSTKINFAAGNASYLWPFCPFLNSTFLSDHIILTLVSSHQENPIKSQSLNTSSWSHLVFLRVKTIQKIKIHNFDLNEESLLKNERKMCL